MSSRNGCFQKKRKKVRELNIQKYGCLTCEYCGDNKLTATHNQKNTATIDHLKPISAGGGNEWTNLYIACLNCNHKKNHYADLRGKHFSSISKLRAFLSGIEG